MANKSDSFFGELTTRTWALTAWTPALGKRGWMVEDNIYKSQGLVDAVHAAVEPVDWKNVMAPGIGVGGRFNFMRLVTGHERTSDYVPTPIVPTFYRHGFLEHARKFRSVIEGLRQSNPIFYKGRLPKHSRYVTRVELFPLKLGVAGDNPQDAMTNIANIWNDSSKKDLLPDFPSELWCWVEEDQIYGMIVPDCDNPYDLAEFRTSAQTWFKEAVPLGEMLKPVAAYRTDPYGFWDLVDVVPSFRLGDPIEEESSQPDEHY